MTIAKVVEISAESPEGFEAAAKHGLERARRTLDGIQGAWIKDQQIDLGKDGTPSFRVNMKVTFIMKD